MREASAPASRSRPGKAAALVAVLLVAAQAASASAASPGTNPFTSAVTRFILDDGTIESIEARDGVPSDYIPSSVFYHFCAPPGDSETNTVATGTFTVAPDGKLTGTCHADRTTTSADGASTVTVKDGTLSGQYDLAAQTVTFHFEGTTQETYVQPSTCQGANCGPMTAVMGIVMDGPVSGGEVIGDRAEGIAHHTYACGPANVCFLTKQVATASFLIQFLPALPSEPPAAGGGGTGGDDDGFGGLLPLLMIIFLLLLLAAAIAFLRARGGGAPGTTAVVPASPLTPSGSAADQTAADALGFLEVSAANAERERQGAEEAARAARQSSPPPPSEPPSAKLTPPTPGQSGTLNLEGEGWAGTRSDTADAFAEGWVASTGALGSPGSFRPQSPPPAEPKTPEQAIKDEASNIIDALDPDAPNPPPADPRPKTG